MISKIFSVQNKAVLVTGGASGLGLEMVRAFVENGARVAVVDCNEKSLDTAAQEFGHDVLYHVADVSKQNEIGRAVNDAHAHFGALDVVIANAGVTDAEPALLHETTNDVWNRVMDINVEGLFFTARPALGLMVQDCFRARPLRHPKALSSISPVNWPFNMRRIIYR
jgi:3-oxoacyl-[acyl-carrier protein] reductase